MIISGKGSGIDLKSSAPGAGFYGSLLKSNRTIRRKKRERKKAEKVKEEREEKKAEEAESKNDRTLQHLLPRSLTSD